MKKIIAFVLLVSSLGVFAQETNKVEKEFISQLKQLKQLESKFKYKSGEIDLQSGLAKINVSDKFRYLGPDDAETVLTKMWGNPSTGEKTLGMIFPVDLTPLDRECWAVIITYSADGYVKDSDADKINYDDLLKEMKEGTKEASKERREQGYSEIELVGWATPPRYDKATHKMYWAKELKFADSKINTLNYNIRVLGRRGVLVLNAVASITDLKMIEQHTPEILSMVDFKEGNRYADFDGKTDKVAAYGLAALVAGGIAAKAGFFKVLWLGLLAAKKFVIIALIAIGSFIKKLFSKKETETAQ